MRKQGVRLDKTDPYLLFILTLTFVVLRYQREHEEEEEK